MTTKKKFISFSRQLDDKKGVNEPDQSYSDLSEPEQLILDFFHPTFSFFLSNIEMGRRGVLTI